MSGVLATLQRELKAYFYSPLAYVVLCFLLVVNGIVFALILSFLNDPMSPGGRPLDFFFTSIWIVILAVVPMLTMRLLAEERRSGSIEVLMTAPVTEGQVVAGKYLAALLFYVFLWLPTLTYAAVVASGSEIDWGKVAAGYLGIFLVGALFLAVGVFASAMTANQIIAAVLSFAIILAMWFFSAVEYLVNSPELKQVLAYLSIPQHMEELARGVVDTRRLVFYGTTTLFFLFLTARALEARKWR